MEGAECRLAERFLLGGRRGNCRLTTVNCCWALLGVEGKPKCSYWLCSMILEAPIPESCSRNIRVLSSSRSTSSSSPIPSSSKSSGVFGRNGSRYRGIVGCLHSQLRIWHSCFQREGSFARTRHRRLTRAHFKRHCHERYENMWSDSSAGSIWAIE